ncbi:Bacterial phosphonate metabolism protein (PhnI) [Chromobacterium violaceum]|uniref:Bacterial phosphonate metabolism protein (PhnI) n=1 Tax=Chromobacterium violaceum TaxID=536 RepID=A0A3S4HHL5_CHRVL|nr:Bacterial phosphonate metabolism protein (PhnI) [Chromobacterium violaceum]
MGEVSVMVCPEELGFEIDIGEITLTECQMINQFAGSKTAPPQFTRGYGLSFGEAERKAMAMALVDRSLRAEELAKPPTRRRSRPSSRCATATMSRPPASFNT